MVTIVAIGYPNSNISDTKLIFRGLNAVAEFPLNESSFHTRSIETPKGITAAEFELEIQTKHASISAYVKNVPLESQVHVIGATPSEFLAIIGHVSEAKLAPTCQLRCTPTDPPISGPGCVSCKKGGLTFKVCC